MVKRSEIISGVFAILTENYEQNGVRVLTCQLVLLYRLDGENLTCLNVDLNTKNSFELRTNGKQSVIIIVKSWLILEAGCHTCTLM